MLREAIREREIKKRCWKDLGLASRQAAARWIRATSSMNLQVVVNRPVASNDSMGLRGVPALDCRALLRCPD
jgi:hypothetical protein